MPLTNKEKQQRWRDRRKDEREAIERERMMLFLEFSQHFANDLKYQMVKEPDDALRLQIVPQRPDEDHREAVAAFALERDLTPDDLIDKVSEELIARAAKAGMISDGYRNLGKY
jgi:hypothetical protein